MKRNRWSLPNIRQQLERRAIALRQRVMRRWQGHSWPRDEDVALALPFAFDLSAVRAPERGIVIICHLFYPEIADDLRALLGNVPFPADLFLSTDTEAKRTALRESFADWPAGSLEVRLSPNRGRDIAPKYITFADVYAHYELVLFIHGKKSLKADGDGGNDWRSLLYGTLAGSPDIVRSIVALFAQRSDIGIIAPQHYSLIRDFIHWDENFGHARRLARRFGVTLSREQPVDFAAGSMFWARTAAVRPLLDLGLTYADFPRERGQVRRTIQHAIERLMFVVAEHAGYGWAKVAVPAHCPGDLTVIAVDSPATLDDVLDRTRRKVLP